MIIPARTSAFRTPAAARGRRLAGGWRALQPGRRCRGSTGPRRGRGAAAGLGAASPTVTRSLQSCCCCCCCYYQWWWFYWCCRCRLRCRRWWWSHWQWGCQTHRPKGPPSPPVLASWSSSLASVRVQCAPASARLRSAATVGASCGGWTCCCWCCC